MDQVTATPGAALPQATPAAPPIGGDSVRSGINSILKASTTGETQTITSQVGDLVKQASESTGMQQAAQELQQKAEGAGEATPPATPDPAAAEEFEDDDADQVVADSSADPGQQTAQQLGKSAKRNAAYQWAKQIASVYHGQEMKNVSPEQLPTVEEFKSMRDASGELEAFRFHFAQATPEAHGTLIAHLNQQDPKAMAAFAQNMVASLPQVNPEAYRAVRTPILARTVADFYRAAEVSADPEAKETLGRAAQVFEYFLTGGRHYRELPFLDGAATQNGQTPQGPQFDPRFQAALEENRRLKAQQTAAVQQQEQFRIQSLESQVDQSINTSFLQKTEEAIWPIKSGYTADPKAFEGKLEMFRREVDQLVANNPNFPAYQRIRWNAVRGGDAAGIKAAEQKYDLMVQAAITALKPSYIRNSRSQIEQQNQTRHDELRQAAAARQPSPSAQPATQATMQPDISTMSVRQGVAALLRG